MLFYFELLNAVQRVHFAGRSVTSPLFPLKK
uniref:Uncharacterized protein n=1 Tax=MELD virus sp. TaxID=2834287 RepID=A0A8S5L5W2_9VIRU|nr:MAG TPA: hypothetical protein [MELD virus sp.]